MDGFAIVRKMKINYRLIKGISWYFLGATIGVALDVFQKSLGEHLASFEITFWRFLVATLTLLPWFIKQGKKEGHYLSPYWKIHAFRALLLFVGMVLWCYGIVLVPINTATALNYSIPFFTLLLSIPFLKERVDRSRWISTIIGFIGVLVVLNPSSMSFDCRSTLILLASFLFALLDVFNKKYSCRETMINMLFYTALFTCLLSVIPASFHYHTPSCKDFWQILWLGIGANLMFYCLLKAFFYMDASALAPFRYTDFLVSALFGYLFFAEKPTIAACLGFIIIVPCTLYLTYQENKKGSR